MRANVQQGPFAQWIWIRVVLIALFAAAAFCPAEEGTAPRRRVAVLGFKNLRNDENSDWIGAVTAETLATKLAGLRALSVIEREQIQKVIEEQNLQATVLVDSNAAVKTGRLLGAQSVVVGSFVVAEGQVRFNVRIVEVESGEVLDAMTQGGAQADVMNLPVVLAERVVRSLSLKVLVQGGEKRVAETGSAVTMGEEETRKLAEKPTASAEAYEAYGRGVDLGNKNRWREAQVEFEKATRIDPSFGLAWMELGVMHFNQGSWPTAIECHEKAEELFRAGANEKDLAVALKNIGNVHRSQGHYDEAMKLYEQALAMSRRLGEDADAAKVLNNIGMARERQGRYEEAIKAYGESLAIKRRIGDEPGVGRTLNNMASAHYRQRRYDEAEKGFEEALAIRRRLGDELGVAGSLAGIAMICSNRKAYEESMKRYDEALAIYRRLGDEPSAAQVLNNMGAVHRNQGHYDDAMRLYEESLAMRRRLGDEPGVAQTLYNMARVHQARAEYVKALPPAREAKAIAHRLGIPLASNCDKLVAELEQKAGR
ncbi:MAG: FlgO family outer membrane protein [Planctomycetota bacterium]